MTTSEVAALWENNAATWTAHSRAGHDVYRDALNTPAFLASLPPVRGLLGLDVGCGEGSNTRKVAQLGATMQGIDIAPTFIRHAREMETDSPLGITYVVGDGAALPFFNGSFDFATAFMSLMDMPDQAQALREVARVLRPDGFFQFSILHPCFVPPYRKMLRDADGKDRALEVAGYFNSTDGQVETFWFNSVSPEERARVAPFRVPRFHRTLGGWVDIIRSAGLVIEALGEPCASEELAKAEPIVADSRIAPLFLHFRVSKSA